MCAILSLPGINSVKTDAAGESGLEDRRQARNRSLRLALMTTVIARMSGVLLQVVSLPIAAMQLGPAGFSIYAMLGSLLAAMTLSNLGIGRATTLHMSRALAIGEMRTSRELFLASLSVVLVIATSVSALAVLLILMTPLLPLVFAQHLEQLPAPVGPALFVCFVLLATQLLLVFEAAQLAQQRQHRLNIALGAGTFVAAVSVWLVANTSPSVLNILLAVHMPVIMVRAFNAAGVWIDISPRREDFVVAWTHMRDVLKDGLRFVSGTTVPNFLCHAFSVLAVGLFATPLASASFAAVMNAIILATSVNNLIVTPLSGAIPEAHQSGDYAWLRKAVIRMFGGSFVCGFFVFLVFAITGEPLFDLWYGGTLAPQGPELLGAGLYFLVLSIEVSNFTYLSNTGLLHGASRALLIKAICSAISVLVVAYFGHFSLVFWVLLANNIVFALIPHSVMTIAALRRNPVHEH